MQARLISNSLYLIAMFICLTSCADPRRDPSLEENVIRGLAAASKFQGHYEQMRLVRVWSSVDVTLRPSSNWWDFKCIELDIYFINHQLNELVGFYEGGEEWGTWPFSWGHLWEYKKEDSEPFDFVLDISVPQVAAATLANRAGDRGPWLWILLCQPTKLNITEPTWFFMSTNTLEATAVGARSEQVRRNVAAEEMCVGPYPP
ncbi:hypothetical protein JMJ35_008916 [Cladonia borealis]|uniref:Uncharacterized protein n=1 Tax=Cladonia borealis TaxID=184061 RepID=A0AA39QV52_9LECA|nr:hypothetical protein JMJ35_008916 [Cladonia borealis]